MNQRRHVVKINQAKEIAVVDVHTGFFGEPRFTAGVITVEMRPVTVCKTFGVYGTREEAEQAATAALDQQVTK